VACEGRQIEPDAFGMGFNDIGDALICEALANVAALADGPKQGPGGDAGCLAPCSQGLHRAGDRAGHDANDRAPSLLVCFAAANGDPNARLAFLDVFAVEGDELGASKSASEPQEEQRTVP
jgi:hypothetical protein